MKLVTLQNKQILDEIESKGEYTPNLMYNMMEEYQEMFEQYKKKTNISINAAIWAWYIFDYERMGKIPSKSIINNMQNFFYDPNKNLVLLLEVPDSIVMLSDAYAWASYISDTDEERIKNPYKWDAVVNWDKGIENVQAIFPKIKKEYIIDLMNIGTDKNEGNVIWK